MHKFAMEVKELEELTKSILEVLAIMSVTELSEEAVIFAATAKILSKSDLPHRINNLLMLAESARTVHRSDEETERAAFEKCWESATKDWAWPMVANKFTRNPDNTNEYAHSWTRSAWLAWQLRAETFNLSK